MKIAICASLDFTNEIKDCKEKLESIGCQVIIPKTSELIIKGAVTLDQIIKEKESGEIAQRAIQQDTFKYYFDVIKSVDAILVLNLDKKGIQNYIGGNTFLEMGFAHILDKQIYLLNDIPEMMYAAEITAMQPVVIQGDLAKIKAAINTCQK